jgi:hypothetical protein
VTVSSSVATRERARRQRTWGALFASVFACASCTAPVVDDAGQAADAGTLETMPPGFTRCAGSVCQPGTRCDVGECRPGCQFDSHCLPSERCDGSVCRTVSARACIDDDGAVACGEAECAASSWCRDPVDGVCLDGCRSSANCPCGHVCTTTAVVGSGACTDPSGTPVCGDDVCQPGESEVTCAADCVSWAGECQEGCEQYLFRECPNFDDASCVLACNEASEAEQRDFVACAANGAVVCSTACLSILGL